MAQVAQPPGLLGAKGVLGAKVGQATRRLAPGVEVRYRRGPMTRTAHHHAHHPSTRRGGLERMRAPIG